MIPDLKVSLSELKQCYAESIGDNDTMVLVKGVIPYTRWELELVIDYLQYNNHLLDSDVITFKHKESV